MNDEISIGDLANLIISQMNSCTNTIQLSKERTRPKNSEVDTLLCDNSKILNHTSWRPKYSLRQGMKEVVEWMKNPKIIGLYKSENYNV